MNGPEHYWAMLSGGGDTIIQVPLERLALRRRLKKKGFTCGEAGILSSITLRSLTCRGRPCAATSWATLSACQGYIQHFGMLSNEQMAMFDNMFFNMSAEDVKCMDPVQRNALEVGPSLTTSLKTLFPLKIYNMHLMYVDMIIWTSCIHRVA